MLAPSAAAAAAAAAPGDTDVPGVLLLLLLLLLTRTLMSPQTRLLGRRPDRALHSEVLPLQDTEATSGTESRAFSHQCHQHKHSDIVALYMVIPFMLTWSGSKP
jgi:hypothetical protein